jgi:hypothetical protein
MVLQGIRDHLPYKHAAAKAGISYVLLRRWITRGEEGQSPEYVKFFNDIKKAEADSIEDLLSTIYNAGKQGSWQASAWILERRHSDEFARKEKTELTGKDGGPVQSEVNDGATKRQERFSELFRQLNAYRTGYDDRRGEESRAKPLDSGSPDDTAT